MKPSIELKVGSNLCVVSAYDEVFRDLGDFTSRVKVAYCVRHGYDFRAFREGFDPARHPSWSKILFVREVLKEYEWVFWIDADAIFTNHSLKITDILGLGGDMYVCREVKNIINFGVFLIRRCDWSEWLLDRMWKAEKWRWAGAWEQSAFNELAYRNQIANQVVHFPMRAFNAVAPPYEVEEMLWRVGDFIAHRIGGMYPVADRKMMLADCLLKSGLGCLI